MMLAATMCIMLPLAGCSGVPASVPVTPAASPPQVVFFAEGTGTKAGAVTMRSESGGTIQKDVALPLHNATTGVLGLASDRFRRGDSLYLSLQNSEGSGSVTCRIEVDGAVVDTATSSGAYKIATCVGRVP
jgi:hypothetical protein